MLMEGWNVIVVVLQNTYKIRFSKDFSVFFFFPSFLQRTCTMEFEELRAQIKNFESVASSIPSRHRKVNGCTGKMGKAVVEAAVSAGLDVVPVSFSSLEVSGKTVQVGGKKIQVYGPSDRENILASTFDECPNLVVVDYTVPAAVNAGVLKKIGTYNMQLPCTRTLTTQFARGDNVVAFLAAMEIMAEQFPGAFSGHFSDLSEGGGEGEQRNRSLRNFSFKKPRSVDRFKTLHFSKSKDECEYLINLAKSHMQKSSVVDSTPTVFTLASCAIYNRQLLHMRLGKYSHPSLDCTIETE
ncbi:hypothetical protein RHSIM_RhsimUnG0159300 [Rhododendron simsii]|uniref:Dihydrodipicolinate reductase N-terminal domain-containing protein n=1 Tax=Rhododendron simsii TaxID=118357 RepID=A0A834L3Z7_RHOSS|nr:hypothetical protein RHSIM_RhsimUnG0159300 [Rhododendron simsii]